MRNSGGTPAVMWRSEALRWTISSSSWRRVTTGVLSFVDASGPGIPRPTAPVLDLVGGGFLEHFLDGRETALQLLQRVAAERQHPLRDRQLLDLIGGSALEHQVTHP